MVGDDGAFLRESGDVFGFTAEERLRDEKGKVGVLNSGLLEFRIQYALHFFPYGITVRFDNHTSAYCGLFCQIGLHYEVVVPLRIILAPWGQFLSHCLYL